MDRIERSDFYAHFGQAVRHERQARGLTQTDLGEALNLTRASIANIEAGRQQCALHAAIVLAESLALPLSDLLPPSVPVPEEADSRQRLLDSVSPRHRNDIALVLSRSRQPDKKVAG